MGAPLIEQVGKRLFLTRAGEETFAAASDVIARLRGLATSLSDLGGRVAGPLRIGAVTSAEFFMPHFLGRFLRDHPDVLPQLEVTNREQVIARIADNADDFVIMGQVPEGMAVTATPFMENRLAPIAHPDHAMAGRADVALADFAGERFLMREAGSGTRSAAERLFGQHGLQARVYMELGSIEAIKQAVMAGLGVSVQSHSSIALEVETGRIAALDVEGFPLRRTWYAVHLRGKELGLTARTFLDFLVREAAAPGAQHHDVAV
jgi:DNA-binding transcriptional LysR family regulator